MHHGNLVRQRQRLGLIVRHVNRGDAETLLKLADLAAHFDAQPRIERESAAWDFKFAKVAQAAQVTAEVVSCGGVRRVELRMASDEEFAGGSRESLEAFRQIPCAGSRFAPGAQQCFEAVGAPANPAAERMHLISALTIP